MAPHPCPKQEKSAGRCLEEDCPWLMTGFAYDSEGRKVEKRSCTVITLAKAMTGKVNR